MKFVWDKIVELWQDRFARVVSFVFFGVALVLFGYLFEYKNSVMVLGMVLTLFQFLLNVFIAVLFGLNAGLFVQEYKQFRAAGNTVASSFAGLFFGALATGCPVCGTGFFTSFLAFFGMAGSLAALPLKGVELKLLSIALLAGTFVVKARTNRFSSSLTCGSLTRETIRKN